MSSAQAMWARPKNTDGPTAAASQVRGFWGTFFIRYLMGANEHLVVVKNVRNRETESAGPSNHALSRVEDVNCGGQARPLRGLIAVPHVKVIRSRPLGTVAERGAETARTGG